MDTLTTKQGRDDKRSSSDKLNAASMTAALLLIAGCSFVIFGEPDLSFLDKSSPEPVFVSACPDKATRYDRAEKAIRNRAHDTIIALAKCAISGEDWVWAEAVLRESVMQESAPASLMLGEMYDPGRLQSSRPSDFPTSYSAAFDCYRKADAAGMEHIEALKRNANERKNAVDNRARRFLDSPNSDGKCGQNVN